MSERRAVYKVSEHDEQVALFQWAVTVPELQWMFAIPNGTRTSIGIARRMKAEGVRKGVADIFVPVARGGFHGLFIEMKSETGSATPEQREFVAAMRMAGYAAQICNGFDNARYIITLYLAGQL